MDWLNFAFLPFHSHTVLLSRCRSQQVNSPAAPSGWNSLERAGHVLVPTQPVFIHNPMWDVPRGGERLISRAKKQWAQALQVGRADGSRCPRVCEGRRGGSTVKWGNASGKAQGCPRCFAFLCRQQIFVMHRKLQSVEGVTDVGEGCLNYNICYKWKVDCETAKFWTGLLHWTLVISNPHWLGMFPKLLALWS